MSRRGTQVAWEGVRQWRRVRRVPVESYMHGSCVVSFRSRFWERLSLPHCLKRRRS